MCVSGVKESWPNFVHYRAPVYTSEAEQVLNPVTQEMSPV